jgi:hypothetical protein
MRHAASLAAIPLAALPMLLGLASSPVSACTNVFIAHDGARLVGANLDCSNYAPRVWFVPPSEENHGRYCYGTDPEMRIAEGGVNDRGLFIGVNALDEDTGWAPDPSLPDWEEWDGWFVTGVPDGILARCATVSEAVAVFRSHNLLTLNRVKFLVADRGGASAIVEWSDGRLRVVPRGETDSQISTNFVTSDFGEDEVPCVRYRIAREMLSAGAVAATVAGIRRVLSATHLEFRTPTVVSTITDLATGELHLYYFHDFEQPIRFDLMEEIAEERHGYRVSDLVAVRPYVATVYD